MTREQRLEQALHRIAEYWNGNANTSAMLDACKVTRDLAWQALAEPKAPDAAPDSVRVRIAVAVQYDGQIGSCGVYGSITDQKALACAEEAMGYGDVKAIGFLEGDLPHIPTVQARVVEEKS